MNEKRRAWPHRVGLAAVTTLLSVQAVGCLQDMGPLGAEEVEAEPQGEMTSETLMLESAIPPVWEVHSPYALLATPEALVGFLNSVRSQHGLSSLVLSETLSKAATAHAGFIARHKATYDLGEVTIHEEPEGLEGFTGADCAERASAAGFEGVCLSEVVAFKPTAVGAARSWLDSLYHRFPLLLATASEVGYGEVQDGDILVNVMKVGRHE